MKKKILLAGNSAKEHALAIKFTEGGYEVQVASGNSGIKEIATCPDIRLDSGSELADYAMENEIALTILTSDTTLKSGITNIFQKNNLPVFAPNKTVCDLLYDKANLKKLLYRLKIPTPKFGIFEKSVAAFEYIKNIDIPFVVKTNSRSSAVVLTSTKTAKNIISSYFDEQTQKVIIEDYKPGSHFCLYAITDGYKALSLGSSQPYRFYLDGNGGQLTNGMGACSPNNKLTADNEHYLFKTVIYPLLDYFQSIGTPYMGIIGIEAVLTDDNKIFVTGIIPFMQDSDCQPILNNLDVDLYDIFSSCVNGSFSDDIDEIILKNICSVSVALNCTDKNNTFNTITGLESLNEDTNVNFYANVTKNKYMEFEANYGQNLLLTSSAGTIAYAVSKVYDEIEDIKFNGKYYRKDIGKSLCNNDCIQD